MLELLLVASAVFAFGLVSARVDGTPLTAPMVFTALGLLVGTEGLGWFDLGIEGGAAEILVEATLVLLLFTDAARIDLAVLRRERWLPIRLLGVGLPLTLVLGAIAALVLFPELPLAHVALLAAVLAPTDAALGQAVVSDQRLPVRLRQGLNVESGLNDGIVLPVVTVCLALATAEEEAGGFDVWGEFVARQIGFGVLVGIVSGLVGGRMLTELADRGWVDGLYRQLGTFSVAAIAFSGAELLDGNGFIAAFTAGLAFGSVGRSRRTDITDFTEDEGELLSIVTFTLFGAVLIAPAVDELSWTVLLYAVASLTIVRMGPVLISMFRSGTLIETRLFLGWFGPRGLASILFALVVFEELDTVAGRQVYVVASWTVLVSIFAHGATASPWAGRLARRIEAGDHDMPEMMPASDLPLRRNPG